MKKQINLLRLLIIGLFISITTTSMIAQSTTAVNEQALDSLEKSTLLKLHIDDYSQEETDKKAKLVNIKVFRQVTSFKFDAYIENKNSKKVIFRLLDEDRKVVFEDVPIKKTKYQRVYDFSYLTNPERYQLVLIYDNREHPVMPVTLESIEAIEEHSQLSVEYANVKDLSARK